MSEQYPVQTDHPSRRAFLRVTGGGLAGASILDMLAARRAPAQLRGTSLRILMWSHFVPAYDAWLDDFTRKWGDANGVRARIDHIPTEELPARYAAEFAAGTGHDLIYFQGQILVSQYYKHLVDVGDIAETIGKKYGGWIDSAKQLGQINGVWYGLPDFYITIPVLWRKDLFDSVGVGEPKTWDDLRKAGRLLKPKGHPTGMAFSRCNDSEHNWRALMFCFGAKEIDPSGQNVMLDSKETREAMRFAKAMYDEGMTPEVFSWDNASDNRYLASGVACWIHDAISAFRTTEQTNPPVFKNTFMVPEVAGPTGLRWNVSDPNAYAIWKFSKNIPAAKEYLVALSDSHTAAMTASTGYNMPFLVDQYKKPMPGLGNDAKLAVLQDQLKINAFFGFPGPITTAAQEVLITFVVSDTFTRVARGADIEDTMKWMLGEYRRIYAKHKGA